jgi:hypothetical protein
MTHPRSKTIVVSLALLLAACGEPDAAPSGEAAEHPGGGARTAAPARQGSGDFEGVITVLSTSHGERDEMILRIKGARWRMEMEMDGDRGAMIRDENGRLISVMDDTRQYAFLPQLPDEEEDALTFVPLGRSETIAGYRCDHYRVVDPSGIQDGDAVCVTTELGWVGFGPGGPLGAADERAMRAQFGDGFLILRSVDGQGDGESVVTRVERTAVSDALFAPPPGYTEVGGSAGRAPAGGR